MARVASLSRRLLFGLAVLAGLAAGGHYLYRQLFPNLPPLPDQAGAAEELQVLACLGLVDDQLGIGSLQPLQAGQVEKIDFREGDEVAAGAVLLTLNSRSSQLRTAEARAAVRAAEVQLKEARDRPRQIRNQLAQQEASAAAALYRLEAARRALAGRQSLAKFKLETTEQVEAAEEQVKEMEAMHRVELGKETELRGADPGLAEERAKADLEIAKARLAQAEQVEKEHVLLAPTSGTILRVNVTVGDLVNPTSGQTCILFRSQVKMIVRAEIDQEYAHRIRVGLPAVIRDSNRPSLVWNGRVTRVAPWYTQRRSSPNNTPPRSDDMTLECIIELDPTSTQLLPRQRVRVWIGR